MRCPCLLAQSVATTLCSRQEISCLGVMLHAGISRGCAMIQLPAHNSPPHADPVARERNRAAIASLICAVAWPLSFLGPGLYTLATHSSLLPSQVLDLTALGFAFLPVAGVIASLTGLVRALKQPALRASRWQAYVGLLLGCMWIIGIFVLSDAGPSLVYWLSHLR